MRREERRSNYEKRRDQRLEKRRSSDSDKEVLVRGSYLSEIGRKLELQKFRAWTVWKKETFDCSQTLIRTP